jgi:hypothetical protein
MSRADRLFEALPQMQALNMPEWSKALGCDLFVRRFSTQQEVDLERWSEENRGPDGKPKDGAMALCMVVQMGVVDSTGAPIFEANELEKMKTLDVGLMMTAFNASADFNGLRKKDVEKNVPLESAAPAPVPAPAQADCVSGAAESQ